LAGLSRDVPEKWCDYQEDNIHTLNGQLSVLSTFHGLTDNSSSNIVDVVQYVCTTNPRSIGVAVKLLSSTRLITSYLLSAALSTCPTNVLLCASITDVIQAKDAD
jgi:hypothetical protein